MHVDPLLDVLAVSRFLQKRRPSVQPQAEEEEDLRARRGFLQKHKPPQAVEEASEEEEELRGASTANLLAALHSGDTSAFSHARASSSDEEGSQ